MKIEGCCIFGRKGCLRLLESGASSGGMAHRAKRILKGAFSSMLLICGTCFIAFGVNFWRVAGTAVAPVLPR
jgi:hypothetical protein